ncbi:N-acetylmuramoyl-L-alanine amidase [Bradyrhizobium sp. LMTR 3]|uniref:N-acetylmuramoyl-L-alanine amidase n=1 Tax=Bradyrhizobium sp. LMTR 3 TaxID=189873 RepID=UPI000810AD91|nr:N-acetylmuramoyl-L-alanine amidase [Bradyrhizobium sp. LMTR 3]OCK59399.1 N-acetylmuramoyl-L-alanine amidase [Bradyrhizobium sp. LMTR 3]
MASRANHLVLLGCGLLCTAALLCTQMIGSCAAQGGASQPPASVAAVPGPAAVSNFPIASDARLAGDARQTRFILDLDKPVQFRAFALADPYRVVVDFPQISFSLPAGIGAGGRGLVKAFRYGLVMPGGSRIVFDLTGPAKIAKSYILEAANGQPPRLVIEFEQMDRTAFVQSLPPESRPELRPAIAEANATAQPDSSIAQPPQTPDKRPVVVIDPGHGGVDNGTQAGGGDIMEKNLVLTFGLALRDRIEKSGKYRVVMTRTDDTFIPLGDRVKVARNEAAALLVSIHADALPRGEGDAHGATIYTLSDKATDSEAERLADIENKSDAIGGVSLVDEPTEVADILIDLVQRETKTFSNRFARTLMSEMKNTVRMHKHPLKSAGFRVLKAPDVPSVLVELGYVSNKGDLELLVSENWRNKTVGAMAQAIDAFLAKRLATAGPAK